MLHLKADLFQYLDYKIFPKYLIYFYQIYLLIILNLSLFLKFSKNFPKLLQLHFMLSLSIFVSFSHVPVFGYGGRVGRETEFFEKVSF